MENKPLSRAKSWLQNIKRQGTEADRYVFVGPPRPEPTRPTTIKSAIEALADNSYPAAHLTCPEDMSKLDLFALTEALKTNKSLTSIDLAENELDKDTQEALLDAVSENKNIMSITGMNSLPFRDDSGQRTLDTNITAILAKNENDATTLASHFLNLKTLFGKPHDEVESIIAAINERTAAISQTLEEARAQGDISALGKGGIEQLYDTANGWARRDFYSERFNSPEIPAEALDNLANSVESPSLAPVTFIHTPSDEHQITTLGPILPQVVERG